MIKNYTSNSKQTFDKIQKILASHKAKRVFFEYDDLGKVIALAFSIEMPSSPGVQEPSLLAFKLPARIEKVEAIFLQNKKDKAKYQWEVDKMQLKNEEKDQAYRTAWANIRDWLDAQMALIDTEQAKIQEVFLPYALNNNGKTYFEVIESRGFELEGGLRREK